VRLLVDADLSPGVAGRLREAGHDALHVLDADLATASDQEIVDYAAQESRVIVSSDTDFGMILAVQDRSSPSFILLRHLNDLDPDGQFTLLAANLPSIEEALTQGAVATLSRKHLRVRRLPFSG
jgi:predicted nuclease of predicted toxin-antitoxin system